MTAKLLIVEDQIFFRKGLKKMIEERETGWTVVGEAGNGLEAMKQIAEQKPDLVLTDIRMPLMDGLELAERIRRDRIETDLIILTGYEDFHYAQSAIRYGAIDFLLKPCNEAMLLEVLGKAYASYTARQQAAARLRAAERVKEETLLRACLLRLPYSRHDLDQAVSASFFQGKEIVFVLVDNYFPTARRYRKQDLPLLQFAIANILAEVIGKNGRAARVVPLTYDRFVVMTEGPCPADTLQALRDSVGQVLGIPVTVLPGGRISRMEDVPACYERLEQLREAYEQQHAASSQNPVSRMREYLNRHYMEPCSLTELAGKFHMSAAHLSKQFKKETGDNYIAYLTKLRMEKASVLLVSTEMRVSEIATSVGYDDPNYFTNVFRMVYRMSPSDYRKQRKQQGKKL